MRQRAHSRRLADHPTRSRVCRRTRGQPINITADTLELRDKEKIAIFTGKVKAIQGDSTIECAKLIVYYDGDQEAATPRVAGATPAAKPSRGASTGSLPTSQQIRRMEAEGGVIVTQKDQVAQGDRGVYDMKANTATLFGNVTATQGPNVVKGDKLSVDLDTGYSRVESQGGSQRVSTTLIPKDKAEDDDDDEKKKKQKARREREKEKKKPEAANPAPGPRSAAPAPGAAAAVRPARPTRQTATEPAQTSR